MLSNESVLKDNHITELNATIEQKEAIILKLDTLTNTQAETLQVLFDEKIKQQKKIKRSFWMGAITGAGAIVLTIILLK